MRHFLTHDWPIRLYFSVFYGAIIWAVLIVLWPWDWKGRRKAFTFKSRKDKFDE